MRTRLVLTDIMQAAVLRYRALLANSPQGDYQSLGRILVLVTIGAGWLLVQFAIVPAWRNWANADAIQRVLSQQHYEMTQWQHQVLEAQTKTPVLPAPTTQQLDQATRDLLGNQATITPNAKAGQLVVDFSEITGEALMQWTTLVEQTLQTPVALLAMRRSPSTLLWSGQVTLTPPPATDKGSVSGSTSQVRK